MNFDENFYAHLEREEQATAKMIRLATKGPSLPDIEDDGTNDEVEAYKRERETEYAEMEYASSEPY